MGWLSSRAVLTTRARLVRVQIWIMTRGLEAGARPAEARGGRGCGLGGEVALTWTQGDETDLEVRSVSVAACRVTALQQRGNGRKFVQPEYSANVSRSSPSLFGFPLDSWFTNIIKCEAVPATTAHRHRVSPWLSSDPELFLLCSSWRAPVHTTVQ